MRILVDTNILFSAILFPGSTPAKALEHAIEYHKVVLCAQNIVELREIVNRKIPQRLADTDELCHYFRLRHFHTAYHIIAHGNSPGMCTFWYENFPQSRFKDT